MKVSELKELLEDVDDDYDVILMDPACHCYDYDEWELQEVRVQYKTVMLLP